MNRHRSALWRIGEGWDIHVLRAGRRLVLGGVEIPHSHGLDGHSDADALCHAITDALFGAAALGRRPRGSQARRRRLSAPAATVQPGRNRPAK